MFPACMFHAGGSLSQILKVMLFFPPPAQFLQPKNNLLCRASARVISDVNCFSIWVSQGPMRQFKMLLDVLASHTQADVSRLTWSWGWGCRDEYLHSLHPLSPWPKSVINAEWTAFPKHFFVLSVTIQSHHKCAFTHAQCLAQGRCENLQSRGLGLNQWSSTTTATLSSTNSLTFCMNDLFFFKLITSLHRFHPLIYPLLFFVTVVSQMGGATVTRHVFYYLSHLFLFRSIWSDGLIMLDRSKTLIIPE